MLGEIKNPPRLHPLDVRLSQKRDLVFLSPLKVRYDGLSRIEALEESSAKLVTGCLRFFLWCQFTRFSTVSSV